jgi:succinate dehydrogenase / fumarate reductase iron-sulfur subunit
MQFVSAKSVQFALLPQGKPEATRRELAMLKEMYNCRFGNCSNHRACENACPKEVSISHIARFNREFLKVALFAKLDN